MKKVLLLTSIFCVTLLHAQDESFTMTQIGNEGALDNPWEVIYGPDDMLWITERSGKRILRVDPETGDQDELITINEVNQTGGQDGLLGMALHPELGEDTGNDYVYVSYTYDDDGRRQKLVRYTYSVSDNNGSLSDPMELISGMLASNDHNSGRLKYGPDGKLYYTIGDQGNNQLSRHCLPIMAQQLPTQEEVDNEDWSAYVGKILRLNTDGSIPDDNPTLDGVQSHVYTYGHRNAQGIVFSSDGLLYASEHGPRTDDEINLIQAGMNYGWPHVAGYNDDMAYEYCNWSTADDCESTSHSNSFCPASATSATESSWSHDDFVPPIETFFTVGNDFDFSDNPCSPGGQWLCNPTVAPSSIDVYESDAIPGWNNSLLIPALKDGRVYKLQLSESGETIEGDTAELWNTQNRYRDIAIHPDGEIFYIITDNGGGAISLSEDDTYDLHNTGTILKFEYTGEDTGPNSIDNSMAGADFFEIYPNPAESYIQIRFTEEASHTSKQIEVLDIKGRSVIEKRSNVQTETINTQHLSQGVYMVKITTASGRSNVQKLVIQ